MNRARDAQKKAASDEPLASEREEEDRTTLFINESGSAWISANLGLLRIVRAPVWHGNGRRRRRFFVCLCSFRESYALTAQRHQMNVPLCE